MLGGTRHAGCASLPQKPPKLLRGPLKARAGCAAERCGAVRKRSGADGTDGTGRDCRRGGRQPARGGGMSVSGWRGFWRLDEEGDGGGGGGGCHFASFCCCCCCCWFLWNGILLGTVGWSCVVRLGSVGTGRGGDLDFAWWIVYMELKVAWFAIRLVVTMFLLVFFGFSLLGCFFFLLYCRDSA